LAWLWFRDLFIFWSLSLRHCLPISLVFYGFLQ
jgi:hypothetical protein